MSGRRRSVQQLVRLAAKMLISSKMLQVSAFSHTPVLPKLRFQNLDVYQAGSVRSLLLQRISM